MSKYNKFIEMICDKDLIHNIDLTVYNVKKEDDEKAWMNKRTNNNDIDRPVLQVVKDYSYNYVVGNKVNKNVIKEYYEYDYGIIINDKLFEDIEKWVDSFDNTEKWYNFSFVSEMLNS